MRSLGVGLLLALVTAGAAVGSEIELKTPADGAAVKRGEPGAEGRRELPVVLKVQDVKGSYAIPFIQASDTLAARTTFAAETVAKAQVSLLAGGSRVGEAVTTTPSGADAVFRGVAPGEYTIEVAGLDAAGKVVSRDLHGPVGVGVVIAALGDSITEGYHGQGFKRDDLDLTAAAFPAEAVSKDGRNYPHYAPTTAHHRPDINCFTSWMPRLNDLLTTKWKQPVFIANEGWGGITTGRYLAMMRSDKGWQERMRLLKPNVWLIHLGVNDERAKLPAAEVAANLSAMVDILRTEYGADPANIYLATPSYDYAPGAAEILAAYAKEIGKLVAEKGLRRGPDFFAAYEGKRAKYYGNDPVHPNAAGVELMARLWAKALAATPPRLTAAAQERPLGLNNTLLIFGDSIVAGGYGTLVVPLIQKAHPGIVFENKGIGGTALTDITYPPNTHRAENGVNRYVRDVIDRRPRIFVMEYGTNDNSFWNLHGKPEVGLREFERVYRNVIQEIRRALPDTLVVVQTISPSIYPRHDFEDWTAAANTVIQDIAIDEGLVVAPVSRRLGHDYTGFPDGIHPDEKGKKQIAEILADTILKAGPQSKSRADTSSGRRITFA